MTPDTDAPDFMNIDSLLADEERQIRDVVARWIDERVDADHRRRAFEEGRFPRELVPEMAELGIFGARSRTTAAPG
jgi:glutaryl-CoA dehydrogenase